MAAYDQKAPILSNVPFDAKLDRDVTVFTKIEELDNAAHCVVYLDEVGEVMNSHEWNTVPNSVRNKLIELRKHHVRLEMTAQKLRQTDVSLKNIVWEVRFPVEKSFPVIGWFCWEARRNDMLCENGSLLRRGDRTWWKSLIGMATVYVWRSCTLEEAESYYVNLLGEGKKKKEEEPGVVTGWRLFDQRMADLYDSKYSIARNFDFTRKKKGVNISTAPNGA